MSDYFSRIRSGVEKHLTIKKEGKELFKIATKRRRFSLSSQKKFVSCSLHISKLYNNNNKN